MPRKRLLKRSPWQVLSWYTKTLWTAQPGDDATQYTFETCLGTAQANYKGRKVMGLVLESVDGSEHCNLPLIIDCNAIPNNRD